MTVPGSRLLQRVLEVVGPGDFLAFNSHGDSPFSRCVYSIARRI
jgi:hypothetical protein